MKPIMPPRKRIEPSLREVTEPTFGESGSVTSRAENRRAGAANVLAANIDETFGLLFEKLGSTNIDNPSANISPFEVDTLASELIAVRNAKDIVDGRESALKAYATEVINKQIEFEGNDPTETSGYLVSPENGIKLSKEVSGGKLNVDIDLLKKNLDEDQFNSIVNHVVIIKTINYPGGKSVEETDEYYELNEEALEKELKTGNIGMEQVLQSTLPSKTRTSLYVRKL